MCWWNPVATRELGQERRNSVKGPSGVDDDHDEQRQLLHRRQLTEMDKIDYFERKCHVFFLPQTLVSQNEGASQTWKERHVSGET